jgi:hypothetical protein
VGCCAPEETGATCGLSFETTDRKKERGFEPFGGSFVTVIRNVISKVYGYSNLQLARARPVIVIVARSDRVFELLASVNKVERVYRE